MKITSEPVEIGEDEGFIASDSIQYLLYFPLKRAVFHISQRARDILGEKREDDTKKSLTSRISQVLTTKNQSSIEPIPQVDRENNVLGCALTTACNLRCTYCHANAGMTNRFMGNLLIDAAIDGRGQSGLTHL